MKLVLFDIDGTLLSTEGAARRAFHATLLDVYGTAGPIDTHSFAGKTDPQIARELLALAGLARAHIDEGLDALWHGYLDRLAHELSNGSHRTRVMPGVQPLLDRLAGMQDDVVVALLTGNILPGAQLKLASGGIDRHFAFGAFGSDDERRDRLAGDRGRARAPAHRPVVPGRRRRRPGRHACRRLVRPWHRLPRGGSRDRSLPGGAAGRGRRRRRLGDAGGHRRRRGLDRPLTACRSDTAAAMFGAAIRHTNRENHGAAPEKAE